MPALDTLRIDEHRLLRLLHIAISEDLGEGGDITTAAVCRHGDVPDAANARIVCGQAGVVCGLVLVPLILEQFEKRLAGSRVRGAAPQAELLPSEVADGHQVACGTWLGTLSGNRKTLLASERIVLNFLQKLSGVATLTRSFVDAVEGTGAKIYDTRKTTPGWRDLEKYAVRCGGGHNHRFGLHDAVLVKDNHLGGVSSARLGQHAFEILNHIQALRLEPAIVEFEVDDLDQLEQLLKVVGIDVILLDNFSQEDLRRAVELRNRSGLQNKVELEASGGITLDEVHDIAATGVERISVGALTHSAAAMDIGLEFEQ